MERAKRNRMKFGAGNLDLNICRQNKYQPSSVTPI
jgi:hypothetical protein